MPARTETDLAATFALNCRTRRRQLGLTQEQITDTARVGSNFVQRLEAGHRLPTLWYAVRMADALQTTVGALLGETQ